MTKKYHIQKSPFIVPTVNGKLIEEHFGLASIKTELSIAFYFFSTQIKR